MNRRDFFLLSTCFMTRATLTGAGISCRRVSVCPSVSHKLVSYKPTETAKCRIVLTTPHYSPVNLVSSCRRYRQNSNGVTLNGGAKRKWGRLNAGAVAAIDDFRREALSA